jgi:hypothetical protein
LATEEAKKENMLRMTELSLEVLAAEVWDTLGDSAIVLGKGMGDSILEMLEKEEGLEIAGENPLDVSKEIDRIFVDEFGFAKEISVDVDKDAVATIKVNNCINTKFTDKMLASGITMNYTCPIMLATSAALRQVGMKGRVKIERWPEGKGCKIIFSPV